MTNGLLSNNKTGQAYNVNTEYGITVKYKFSVKWDDIQGKGTIRAYLFTPDGQDPWEYECYIDKPYVKIDGPSTIKYGEILEYKVTHNPNMTGTVVWTVADGLTITGSSTQTIVKITANTNEWKTIANAIRLKANTSEGELYNFKSIKKVKKR